MQRKLPEIYEDDLKLLLMGDKEPEPVIFCNQARLPMDGLGHQPSHKISDLQFVEHGRYSGVRRVVYRL